MIENAEKILSLRDRKTILSLIQSGVNSSHQEFLSIAENQKSTVFGEKTRQFAAIEYSNYCESNCIYCGYREENLFVKRFRLEPEEIIEKAVKISALGYKKILLQSGIDTFYDTDIISYIIYRIRQITDLEIFLAIGERGFDEYRNWKFAGASGYFLKFETSNPEIFKSFRCKRFLKEKVDHIYYLKNLGYKIGTGTIFGLPNLNDEDLLADLDLIADIDPEYVLFDMFTPRAFTPYQKKKCPDQEQFLRIIAAARILFPETEIISSAYSNPPDDEFKAKLVKSGVNLEIINF